MIICKDTLVTYPLLARRDLRKPSILSVRKNRARPGPNPAQPEEKSRVVPSDQSPRYDMWFFLIVLFVWFPSHFSYIAIMLSIALCLMYIFYNNMFLKFILFPSSCDFISNDRYFVLLFPIFMTAAWIELRTLLIINLFLLNIKKLISKMKTT